MTFLFRAGFNISYVNGCHWKAIKFVRNKFLTVSKGWFPLGLATRPWGLVANYISQTTLPTLPECIIGRQTSSMDLYLLYILQNCTLSLYWFEKSLMLNITYFTLFNNITNKCQLIITAVADSFWGLIC